LLHYSPNRQTGEAHFVITGMIAKNKSNDAIVAFQKFPDALYSSLTQQAHLLPSNMSLNTGPDAKETPNGPIPNTFAEKTNATTTPGSDPIDDSIDPENEVTGIKLLLIHTGLCLCTFLVGLVRLCGLNVNVAPGRRLMTLLPGLQSDRNCSPCYYHPILVTWRCRMVRLGFLYGTVSRPLTIKRE
jgi:hypothetical protein